MNVKQEINSISNWAKKKYNHKLNLIYMIAILVLQLNLGYGQENDSINVSSNKISIGVRDQLYSKILEENREILVHVPESSIYGFKYPVLYLIDGEYHFESFVGIVKLNVINRLIPEMIVIGISNTDRNRDLTTSHIGDNTNTSGGGENFTKFIENELIPYIDSKYPTLTHRTLIGHSLGGLMVANTLLKHPHLFDNYLAIDPSISWGDNKLLDEAKNVLNKSKFENKSIYTAIANTTQNDNMSFDEALKDTTSSTLHLRSIVEFSKLTNANDQLVSDWKYYPDETHGSLPIVAEHHALKFLFSWFKFDQWDKFYTPEPKLTGEELVEIIVSHHNKISKNLRDSYLPDEYEVNRLAYMYLSRNDPKRALPFFELNINNYPESANAYDSMGDYYMSISDTKNAVNYFTKSLELGGVEGTKEKLRKLNEGK